MGQITGVVQALAIVQEEMFQENLRVVSVNPAIMTMPVNPLGGVGTHVVTRPLSERGQVYRNAAQTFIILVSGRAQPEIKDNQDAFFTTMVDSVDDAFGPCPADLKRRLCMMED